MIVYTVTRAGVDERFVVSDMRPRFNMSMHAPQAPFTPFVSNRMPSHGFGFPGQFGGHQPFGMDSQPSVVYLFTSPEKDQEAVLSETPVYVPLPPGSVRPEVRNRFCGLEGYVIHAVETERLIILFQNLRLYELCATPCRRFCVERCAVYCYCATRK